jgi:hypothetical protein
MDVRMRIAYEGVVVRTRMEMEDGYPLMKLVEVVDGGARSGSDDADSSPGADPNA